MSSMKAVRIHAYGGTDVLAYEDAPCPTAGDGEVIVRVHATSVNPFDCAVRAGYMSAYFTYTLPIILGTDVSGIIEEVGAGVTTFKRGDNVYARGDTRMACMLNMWRCRRRMLLRDRNRLTTFTRRQSLCRPHGLAGAFWYRQSGQRTDRSDPRGGGWCRSFGGAVAKWRGAKVIGTGSRNIDFVAGSASMRRSITPSRHSKMS